jgi:hypothetical protein
MCFSFLQNKHGTDGRWFYVLVGQNNSYSSIPVDGPKVTSAIWGPLDYYIIAGHENGTVCQWDSKVVDCWNLNCKPLNIYPYFIFSLGEHCHLMGFTKSNTFVLTEWSTFIEC